MYRHPQHIFRSKCSKVWNNPRVRVLYPQVSFPEKERTLAYYWVNSFSFPSVGASGGLVLVLNMACFGR